MDRWLKFFTERFPLVNSIGLVTGISLSGIYLSKSPFQFSLFILSFIGIVFVLALLRLIEDIKNLEKDRIAHSNRLLPKGLISKKEAILVIETMQIILFGYSLLLWVLIDGLAALAYIAVVVFFWLRYRDFGLKKWLNRHLWVAGFLNHFIYILIALFAVAAGRPAIFLSLSSWSFGLILFGAFFCLDICNKLDPKEHPIVGTYLHFYGFRFVYNLAVVSLAISAMGAIYLGLGYLLIPVEMIVLAALSAVFFQRTLFRMPQMMANLSLMIHAWAVVILKAMGIYLS